MPRLGKGELTPLALAVVLAFAAAGQWALPGAPPPQDDALAPRRLRMPVPTPVPTYPAVLGAPIFAPDRAPGEAAAAPAGGAASLQLIGIALAGRNASAVVRTADGAVQALRPGESFKGWQLLSVGPNRALFAGPQGRAEVSLGAPAPAGPAATSNGPRPAPETP